MNGDLNVRARRSGVSGDTPMKGIGRAPVIGTSINGWRTPAVAHLRRCSRRLVDRLDIEVDRVSGSRPIIFTTGWRAISARGACSCSATPPIHSPVGGQGMNTGIGDAIDLAWKLAAVVHGRADIEPPRRLRAGAHCLARRLVATTDRAFQSISETGLCPLRAHPLVPLMAALFRFRRARRLMLLTISQTNVNYRQCAHHGFGRSRRGRDRLPWVPQDTGSDNFGSLRSLTRRRMSMAQ